MKPVISIETIRRAYGFYVGMIGTIGIPIETSDFSRDHPYGVQMEMIETTRIPTEMSDSSRGHPSGSHMDMIGTIGIPILQPVIFSRDHP